MKKVIAILVVSMLVMGCVTAFAQEKSHPEKVTNAFTKFWEDLYELITDKIPNTYKDLSPTGTKQTQASTATTTKKSRWYTK
jgi:hypothetical protein